MSLIVESIVHFEKQVVHSISHDIKLQSESFVKEFPV